MRGLPLRLLRAGFGITDAMMQAPPLSANPSAPAPLALPATHASHGGCWLRDPQAGGGTRGIGKGEAIRSEERRVGKEC